MFRILIIDPNTPFRESLRKIRPSRSRKPLPALKGWLS
jgi:hypothetical protein